MQTQNVTLSLSKKTLKKAKLAAVEEGISLSRLLIGLIEQMVAGRERYELARSKHLRLLDRGFDLGTGGGPLAPRTELHER